jgi:hypothetical protein
MLTNTTPERAAKELARFIGSQHHQIRTKDNETFRVLTAREFHQILGFLLEPQNLFDESHIQVMNLGMWGDWAVNSR